MTFRYLSRHRLSALVVLHLGPWCQWLDSHSSEVLGLLLTLIAISGWTFGSLLLLDGRTGVLSLALVGLGGSLATVGVGWLTVLLHVRQIVSGNGAR